jgi:hypothetical protein
MSLTTRSALAVVVLLMPAITVSATAQTVATSYEELRRILTRGQNVVVIDPAGETVRGRVTDVSPESFDLTTGDWRSAESGQRRTFTDGPLTARQRNDKLTNGLLIGFAVGAVAGGLALSRECYRDGNDCTDYGGAGGMFVIGAGIFGGLEPVSGLSSTWPRPTRNSS